MNSEDNEPLLPGPEGRPLRRHTRPKLAVAGVLYFLSALSLAVLTVGVSLLGLDSAFCGAKVQPETVVGPATPTAGGNAVIWDANGWMKAIVYLMLVLSAWLIFAICFNLSVLALKLYDRLPEFCKAAANRANCGPAETYSRLVYAGRLEKTIQMLGLLLLLAIALLQLLYPKCDPLFLLQSAVPSCGVSYKLAGIFHFAIDLNLGSFILACVLILPQLPTAATRILVSQMLFISAFCLCVLGADILPGRVFAQAGSPIHVIGTAINV